MLRNKCAGFTLIEILVVLVLLLLVIYGLLNVTSEGQEAYSLTHSNLAAVSSSNKVIEHITDEIKFSLSITTVNANSISYRDSNNVNCSMFVQDGRFIVQRGSTPTVITDNVQSVTFARDTNDATGRTINIQLVAVDSESKQHPAPTFTFDSTVRPLN